jgi:hypothetical protein
VHEVATAGRRLFDALEARAPARAVQRDEAGSSRRILPSESSVSR